MFEINRVLRAASLRIALGNFLFGFVLTLAASLLILIVFRLIEQTSNIVVFWKQVAYGSAGVCVLGGIVWAIISRPGRLAVARRVDEGASLKETLSTALCVEPRQSTDPWARAAVDSAVRIARGVPVAKAVPIQAPRFWPVPLALALIFAVVYIAVPRLNWFTFSSVPLAQTPEQAEIVQAKQQVTEAMKKVDEMTKKLDLEKPKPEAAEASKPEPKNPEDIRKAAIKELTKINDRLEELRSGEKAQRLEAVQQQLKTLKPTGEATTELSKALTAGNFSQAKQELEKLKQQAQNAGQAGGMSEAQKKEMAKQIDDLAKQMDKMAKNQQALEKQLQAAGVDPKLAGDPNALKKALEQASNLSSEQKQQMQQAAQAQQQAQQSMQQMSQSMQQMSQCMNNGDSQGMQQSAQSAQGQLSELEQMSQEMAMAAAAQSEAQQQMQQMGGQCQGGQCNGDGQGQNQNSSSQWAKNWSQRNGQRTGSGNQSGGTRGADQADFEKVDRKSIGKIGQGPIVGTRLVEGESLKGESKAELVAAVTQADQAATEAIENNTIPREYHDAIKSYFGRLKDKTGAKTPAKPSEPVEPGEAAKDAGNK